MLGYPCQVPFGRFANPSYKLHHYCERKNTRLHIRKRFYADATAMLITSAKELPEQLPDFAIWNGDVEKFLAVLPSEPIFDLIVTSPPYNIGKAYESKEVLEKYLEWQERVIDQLVPRLKDTGSLCWQVGNFVDNGQIAPLDIEFAPIFKKHKLQLRNRIIWHFGHGLHNKRRFSGRYETVMWYTKNR